MQLTIIDELSSLNQTQKYCLINPDFQLVHNHKAKHLQPRYVYLNGDQILKINLY
jgi:hypothetical protein